MLGNPSTDLTVPPLMDGGVMLSYRCTNRCKHCAYRCAPTGRDHWMTPETMRQVFAMLAVEPRLQSVHLAGGEAMLNEDLLVEAIRTARAAGVQLSYLETNAAWVRDADHARDAFRRLADEGLPAVLISASPFHNEFIPFRKTRQGIEAAFDVFGRGGVIVWIPEMYRALATLDETRTHTLEEFFAATGLTAADIPRLYPLTVHGRVVEDLREGYAPRPAEAYADESCARELSSTSHFHVDPYGLLFVGHCPGIAAGSAESFHPKITPQTHPAYSACYHNGPHALFRQAVETWGYVEDPDGYISKCDLCFRVRRHLRRHAAGAYLDIAPPAFYED